LQSIEALSTQIPVLEQEMRSLADVRFSARQALDASLSAKTEISESLRRMNVQPQYSAKITERATEAIQSLNTTSAHVASQPVAIMTNNEGFRPAQQSAVSFGGSPWSNDFGGAAASAALTNVHSDAQTSQDSRVKNSRYSLAPNALSRKKAAKPVFAPLFVFVPQSTSSIKI
jgi:hypothetical protein